MWMWRGVYLHWHIDTAATGTLYKSPKELQVTVACIFLWVLSSKRCVCVSLYSRLHLVHFICVLHFVAT